MIWCTSAWQARFHCTNVHLRAVAGCGGQHAVRCLLWCWPRTLRLLLPCGTTAGLVRQRVQATRALTCRSRLQSRGHTASGGRGPAGMGNIISLFLCCACRGTACPYLHALQCDTATAAAVTAAALQPAAHAAAHAEPGQSAQQASSTSTQQHTSWSLSATHFASFSAQGRRLCCHASDCRLLARAAAAAVPFALLLVERWMALRAARAGGGGASGGCAAAGGQCCPSAVVCGPSLPAACTASAASSRRGTRARPRAIQVWAKGSRCPRLVVIAPWRPAAVCTVWAAGAGTRGAAAGARWCCLERLGALQSPATRVGCRE